MLSLYPVEEANSNVKSWIRQRSRWIKGCLQPWLVHLRNSIQFMKSVGFVDFQAMLLPH